jgi:hypothetical protein
MIDWLTVAAIVTISAASVVCFAGILCVPSTNAKEFAKSLATERAKLQETGKLGKMCVWQCLAALCFG